MSDAIFSFTRKELRDMPITDLKLLATYYGVDYTPDMKKAALLRALLPLPTRMKEPPRYSARIARIMEKKEEEQENER